MEVGPRPAEGRGSSLCEVGSSSADENTYINHLGIVGLIILSKMECMLHLATRVPCKLEITKGV